MEKEHKITPIQAQLLEMLKWFDAFCREKKLRYYAVGGTILGAMRHQGFIPWDDDIDVAMPRRDYEKLKEYAKSEKGRYQFETYDSEAADYCYPFNKLYDTTTTLIEHARVDIIRGVYIDIFPLDGLGDSMEEALVNYRKIKKLNQFYATFKAGVRQGRSWIKNTAVIAFRLIPQCLVSQSALRLKINKLCSKYDFDNCKYGGNLLGAYWEREIIDLSLLGTPKYYAFEDMMLAGPEDADGYLTHIYTDWHKLPPKEKQVSHHDFVYLDLNKSFLVKS